MKKPRYKYENVSCIGVYDADTITVIVDYGNKLTQELKVRFARINAPEVRGDQKEKGIISRDWLRDRILGKNIILESIKMEKYGRLLCEVWDMFGQNLNDELVLKELAEYKDYD